MITSTSTHCLQATITFPRQSIACPSPFGMSLFSHGGYKNPRGANRTSWKIISGQLTSEITLQDHEAFAAHFTRVEFIFTEYHSQVKMANECKIVIFISLSLFAIATGLSFEDSKQGRENYYNFIGEFHKFITLESFLKLTQNCLTEITAKTIKIPLKSWQSIFTTSTSNINRVQALDPCQILIFKIL